MTARIAITTGEPAGIGPELCANLDPGDFDAELVLIGDQTLLRERSGLAGFAAGPFEAHAPVRPGLRLAHVPLVRPARPGHADSDNAAYVLATLDRAIDGCLGGIFDAMVTAPVHKGVINQAGIPFTGHTEYLAARSRARQVVMMLAAPGLRVALATTHLPLRQVADAIDRPRLEAVLRCLHGDLRKRFGIADPRILVAGLNPHAGEDGHLGLEDEQVTRPVIEALRGEGMKLEGPLPADPLFTPPRLEGSDAVLAMYHDQGLPVLKHLGFGRAVNITLGLPFVRTSVDHGTAFELVGRGGADPGSLQAAIRCARELCA